jgi:hypothetical protein
MMTLLKVISPSQASAPRTIALLIGNSTAIAAGIAVHGHAPVTRLCRELLEAGHDPSLALEVYRGTAVCLRVRAIGEGALLTVEEDRNGRPRFVRLGRGVMALPRPSRKVSGRLSDELPSKTSQSSSCRPPRLSDGAPRAVCGGGSQDRRGDVRERVADDGRVEYIARDRLRNDISVHDTFDEATRAVVKRAWGASS